MGELVSVVCHRGAGHTVTYHCVLGQWYRIDDSRPCVASSNPLLQEGNETVGILICKCNEE